MIRLSRASIELRSKKQDAGYRISLYALALSLILNYLPRHKCSSTYIEAFSVFQVYVSGKLALEHIANIWLVRQKCRSSTNEMS